MITTVTQRRGASSIWKITIFTIIGVVLSFILLINYRGFARFDQTIVMWYVGLFHAIFVPAFLLVRLKYPKMEGTLFSFLSSVILGFFSGLISYIVSMAIVGTLVTHLEKLIALHGVTMAITINLSIPLWLMSWFSGGVTSIVVTLLLNFSRRAANDRGH